MVVLMGEVLDAIKKLREYAEEHPLSMDVLLDMKNGAIPVAGDMKEHSIFFMMFDKQYKIVYSVELQPSGKVRHLSISIKEPGKVPSVAFVCFVMGLLGFTSYIENCLVDFEDVDEGIKAVNVLELVKEK